MKIIVVVPYRPDNGHRDRLWHYLRDNYWPQFPWEIVTGQHLQGPFNRSAAINQATQGDDWDLAVIADSDTFVPAEQLHEAVAQTIITRRMTSALNAVVELNQRTTLDILNGKRTLHDGQFGADCVRTGDIQTQSSMIVVPRTLWDRHPLFDERFVGWGGEDNAAWRTAVILGGVDRISGNAYHLWHPPAAGKFRGLDYQRNLKLWRRYQNATTIEDLQAIRCSK